MFGGSEPDLLSTASMCGQSKENISLSLFYSAPNFHLLVTEQSEW